MQIKSITTAAGVNEIDFGNDDSQTTAHFYWFKNLGDSTLYVSAKPNPVAGEDDVAELAAKGAVSVETDEGKVYVLGTGKVEIYRTNSKFCPFELPSTGSGGGGGGTTITVDSELSETSTNPLQNKATTKAINEVKTELSGKSNTDHTHLTSAITDFPDALPANGGNADKANTLSDWAGIELTNANDAPLGISRIHGVTYPDGNAPFDFWATILTLGPNDRNDYRQQFAFPWGKRESEFFPKYRVLDSGTWGEWIEINIKTMIYTIAFSEVTWITSSSGKYVYHIPSLNVNKILSITLSEPWTTLSSDEIIQPYIGNDTQASIMSNVQKTTGNMSVRIVYN